MIFDGIDDLLAMGGHGPYVWASYGLCLLVIAGLLWSALRERDRLRHDINRRARRDGTRTEE